jgi:hypothetical protein
MTTSTLASATEGNQSKTKIFGDRSVKRPETSRVVTVVSSFTVPAARQTLWTETWQRLAQLALARPECKDFRILRNGGDMGHIIVLSEWTSAGEYHRFVRESSLLWLDRVMPGFLLPSELKVLEPGDWPRKWQ